MRNLRAFTFIVLALSWAVPAGAGGGAEKFDAAMAPILAEYLKITEALAADKTEGVVRAADRIVKLSVTLDSSLVGGKHAEHYNDVPRKLREAASKLSKAQDIEKMREDLKDLSRPMAMWSGMSKPAGVYTAYCSMAKGSWLQKGKEIANPYYGSKMLRCGDIVGGHGGDMKEHRKSMKMKGHGGEKHHKDMKDMKDMGGHGGGMMGH